MKKTFRITLLIVVVLTALLIGTQTANAATDGYLTYTVSNGEATITECDDSVSGQYVIPDSHPV